MTAEMREVYESIIQKQEQVKALETEIKNLKARVTQYHDGQVMITEDGFESRIKHTVRNTPKIDRINEKYELEISPEHDPDCYSRSEFDSLTVSRLILG